MGEDRKPPAPAPKPEAPTRKARKFELEAALAEQERTAGPSIYDDDDDRTEVRANTFGAFEEEEDEEERTQVRNPRPAAGDVPTLAEEDDPPENTGRAFYSPPEDLDEEIADDANELIDPKAAPTEPPRCDTQPVPPPAAPITAPRAPPIVSPITAPFAPPMRPAGFSAPPPFVPSVPPAVRAIPPGPHGGGVAVQVPPPPGIPLDGDELAAITRDFQRRRRRVFAVVSVIIALVVIALLVHEPLLEAIRGR